MFGSSGEKGPFGMSIDKKLGATVNDLEGLKSVLTGILGSMRVQSAVEAGTRGAEVARGVEAVTRGAEVVRGVEAATRGAEVVTRAVEGAVKGVEAATRGFEIGRYNSLSLLLQLSSKSIVIHESFQTVSPITDHSHSLVGVWGIRLPESRET